MTKERLISDCNQIIVGIERYVSQGRECYFICVDAFILKRESRLQIVELLEWYGNKYIEGFYRDQAFMYDGKEPVPIGTYNLRKIEHVKAFVNYVVEGGDISLIEK